MYSFSYDITQFINDNSILNFSVRVHNCEQPSVRWYTGSGIYANTWLNITEKIFIPRSGIFIRTEDNTGFVDTKVNNRTSKIARVSIKTIIKDNYNNVLEEK